MHLRTCCPWMKWLLEMQVSLFTVSIWKWEMFRSRCWRHRGFGMAFWGYCFSLSELLQSQSPNSANPSNGMKYMPHWVRRIPDAKLNATCLLNNIWRAVRIHISLFEVTIELLHCNYCLVGSHFINCRDCCDGKGRSSVWKDENSTRRWLSRSSKLFCQSYKVIREETLVFG